MAKSAAPISPAPWSWANNYGAVDDDHWELVDANKNPVTDVWEGYGDAGLCVNKEDRDLIAAAPELLAACRALTEHAEKFYREWDCLGGSEHLRLGQEAIKRAAE